MPTKANASASRRRSVPATRGTRQKLRGRGDYTSDVANEPDLAKRLEKKIDHLERSLVHATPTISKGASMAGRALGSLLGQGDLGALAGEQLSKLFGYGDYSTRIKGNSLMAGVSGNSVPKFQGDGKRGVRLTEREFIGNIVTGALVSGSSLFTRQSFAITPEDQNTFPWLSRIAPLFDQWEPHGIVFEFHTTSSTFNGTSQALGAVIMATDYDVNDPLYPSKQVMENADYACSTVPSSNLLHGVECDPRERPLDVMYTTPRPANLNFSTLGNFQIATQGMSTAGTTVGELWVSYDITFYKKQLVSSTVDNIFLSSTTASSAANAPLITGVLSSNQVVLQQVIGTGTNIILPPSLGSGRFLVTAYTANYQAGDSVSMTPVVTNGVVLNQTFAGGVLAGSAYELLTIVSVTSAGCVLQLGLKNVSAGVCQINIVQVPDNFGV
jgi:hypothetical protein